MEARFFTRTGEIYVSMMRSVILKGEIRLRLFENSVLRKVLRPRREEITGDWGNFRDDVYCLYFLPNLTTTINSRRMKPLWKT